MPVKILSLICLCLLSLASSAQSSRTIGGTVMDSSANAPLENASVALLRMPAMTVVQQHLNRKNGFFFKNLEPGTYRIITTYLGYRPDSLLVRLSKTDTMGVFVHIFLTPSVKGMTEVVVKAVIPPAIVRDDTIAFNAGAYSLRPNSTVEDLLRKLPGVNVDKDGNVTMQGKKVDKIYLDGKEFFLGDLKTATRNLPADIVSQIETYDTQTDRGKLTGIKDNTGTKTINVKLKKDRKHGYFGNVYAGIGNDNGGDDAYSVGGVASSLGSSRWLSASFNANNINNQFLGTDSRAQAQSAGRQKMGSGQFNYREEFNKKLSLVLNGSFNSTQSSVQQSSDKQTFLSDSALHEVRSGQSTNKNRMGQVNGFLAYNIDSMSVLQYRGNWSQSRMQSSSGDTVSITTLKPVDTALSNTGVTNNSNTAHNYNFDNALDLRRRFHKKGRSLYIGLNLSGHHQDQPASIYSRVRYYDSTSQLIKDSITDQRSGQTSSGNGYGAAITYTEPLAAHQILDFNYRINSAISRSDKISYAYDSATGKYDMPDSLTSNHFLSNNTTHYVGAGYNLNAGKYQYQLGLAAQFSDLDNNNYTLHSHIIQHFTNWFPRASLIYSPGRGKNINLAYSGYSTSPTIDQLQPIPDLTNPFLVRLGNPSLQQQFDHSVNVNYSDFNTENFRNLQVSVNGNYTDHKISNSTTILSGGIQQLQYVNTHGNYHLSTNIAYGFPLGNPKHSSGNGNIASYANYGRDVSILNGAENVTTTFGWGGTANLNYHLGDKLYVDGSVNANYNASTYSINTSPPTRSWTERYDLDASYNLPFSITVSSSYNLQVTGAQGGLPSHSVSLWNASIYKGFLHGGQCKLRLSAFDLLNSSSSYSQVQGFNYIMTSKTNLPGRLFLLSLTYNFSKFPVRKAS